MKPACWAKQFISWKKTNVLFWKTFVFLENQRHFFTNKW